MPEGHSRMQSLGRRQVKSAIGKSMKVLVVCCMVLWSCHESSAAKSMHTVFTAECYQYFNWQTLGLYQSFKQSGQGGPVTRLLSCTEEQRQQFVDVDVDVPTHYAPSWSKHPRTGDSYSGINKPVAVRDWLQKVKPPEDIIMIIDDDTIVRRALDPEAMGVRPGWAVAGFYGYMKGVNNALALKHVPTVLPRNDTLAGPLGRRGDQVGGFSIMFKDDLARMANDWVSITEDVRADPDAWETSGDVYTPNKGDKPWIAEMYGYSFGASKNNIWHITNDEIMLYPGYRPAKVLDNQPNVLHYGIKFWVNYTGGVWEFDKHWYRDFDSIRCPLEIERDTQGRHQMNNESEIYLCRRMSMIFDPPPHPSQLVSEGPRRYRDLLSLEAIATVNAALCRRHADRCQPSQFLLDTCKEVFDLAKDVLIAQDDIIREAAQAAGCSDHEPHCKTWAEDGECDKNPDFMVSHCPRSCHKCSNFGSHLASMMANGGSNLSHAARSEVKGSTEGSSSEMTENRGEELSKNVDEQEEGLRQDLQGNPVLEVDKVRDEVAQLQSSKEAKSPDQGRNISLQHKESPDERSSREARSEISRNASNLLLINVDEVDSGRLDDQANTEKAEGDQSAENRSKQAGGIRNPDEKKEVEGQVTHAQHQESSKGFDDSRQQSKEPLQASDKDLVMSPRHLDTAVKNFLSNPGVKKETGSTADDIFKKHSESDAHSSVIKNPSERAEEQAIKAARAGNSQNCRDSKPECQGWAGRGECKNNPVFMLSMCKHSCRVCKQEGEEKTQEELAEMQELQKQAEAHLKNATKTEHLKLRCLQATQFQMQEVHRCLDLAAKGEVFEKVVVRKSNSSLRKSGLSLDAKQTPLKAPSLDTRLAKPRRLKEARGEKEKDDWDIDFSALLVLGVLGTAVYLLARRFIPFLRPMNTARQKAGRQD